MWTYTDLTVRLRLSCHRFGSIRYHDASQWIDDALHPFIHGLHCATSSSTDECDIIYLWYIPFEFTRTVIENRWFTHSVSSADRAYQVVHKSQMLAFKVVGAFFYYTRTSVSPPSAIVCSRDKACMRQMTSEKLQYIIIGYGLLLNQ